MGMVRECLDKREADHEAVEGRSAAARPKARPPRACGGPRDADAGHNGSKIRTHATGRVRSASARRPVGGA